MEYVCCVGVEGVRSVSTSDGSSSTEKCSPLKGSDFLAVEVRLTVVGRRGLAACGDRRGRAGSMSSRLSAGEESDRGVARGRWAPGVELAISVPVRKCELLGRIVYFVLVYHSPCAWRYPGPLTLD